MYRNAIMKITRQPCGILILMWSLLCFGEGKMDGRTLQAQLDEGKDIALRPGQVIEVRESLKFRKAGQRIETVGARTASEYARIVHKDGSQGTLIDAKGKVEHWSKWLRETRSNADSLRRSLMASPEFVRLHGHVNPLNLHKWRNARWLEVIPKTCSEHQLKGEDWPNARQWNEEVLAAMRSKTPSKKEG